MAVERMRRVSVAVLSERLERENARILSDNSFEPLGLEKILSDKSSRLIRQLDENPFDEIYSEITNFLKMTGFSPEFNDQAIDIERDLNIEENLKKIKLLNEKLKNIFDGRNQLKKEIESNRKVLPYLEILSNLNVDLRDITSFEMIRLIFGRVPIKHYEPLIYSSVNVPVLILEVNRDAENVWIFVFTNPHFLAEAYKILHSAYFTEDALPEGYSGTPEKIKTKLEADIKLAELSIEEKELEIQRILFENIDFIQSVYSPVVARKKAFDLASSGGISKGGNVFFLNGWMPEERARQFEEESSKDTLVVTKPAEEISDDTRHDVPVKLKNRGWFFRSFEVITEMYGTPSYNEIDPTPFVAVFFTVMFGFMLGDVGHGLILSLIGLLARRTSRKFGLVLMFAGLSAIIFGIFYGSVFGFDWIPPLLMRPIVSIQRLMIIAIYFGIGIVTTGLVLNIVNGIRQRDWKKALFSGEGIAGLLFYVTTIFSVSYLIVMGKLPIPMEAIAALVALSLGIVFFEEPLGELANGGGFKIPKGYFLVSFISIFNLIIEYFSNAISFVRLASFALTHEALFLAFWTMTIMVLPAPGGGIWGALIFLAGQMILVGLEGLVVFIQDLRLTYYEYFTKFFEGSGHAFKPVGFRD